MPELGLEGNADPPVSLSQWVGQRHAFQSGSAAAEPQPRTPKRSLSSTELDPTSRTVNQPPASLGLLSVTLGCLTSSTRTITGEHGG